MSDPLPTPPVPVGDERREDGYFASLACGHLHPIISEPLTARPQMERFIDLCMATGDTALCPTDPSHGHQTITGLAAPAAPTESVLRDQLDALRKLSAGVVAGPWQAEDTFIVSDAGPYPDDVIADCTDSGAAPFIVASVNYVRALLASVEGEHG